MLRRTISMCVMGVVLLPLGCSKRETAPPATQPAVRIGYCAPEWGGAQYQIMEGLRRRASHKGWETIVLNANFSPQVQHRQIQYLLEQKVAAIVAVPLDSEAIADPIREARAKGVLFYTIDRAPSTQPVNMTVQANNVMAGEQVGKEIARLLKDKHGEVRGVVLELRGELTQSVARERDEGFHRGLNSSAVEVIHADTHWLPREFGDLTAQTLQRRDVDAIYMQSDVIGVPEVLPVLRKMKKLVKRGEKGHIILGGVDGGPQALNAIRQGYMDVSASQPLTDYGIVVDWIDRDRRGEAAQPGFVSAPGASWSPAQIVTSTTGPMLQLATTCVTADNVDSPNLWGNQVTITK